MIAIDTNLLVRLLTNDEPQQAARAIQLFKSGAEIFIGKTALLETAWIRLGVCRCFASGNRPNCRRATVLFFWPAVSEKSSEFCGGRAVARMNR